MPTAASTNVVPGEARADILFQCQHCASPLVVDAAAAGYTVDCLRCGKPTEVPPAHTPPPVQAPPEVAIDPRAADVLQRSLKENESQRTEITSYVNQLNIQLSRWQLRLQTLNQRRDELKAELARLSGA